MLRIKTVADTLTVLRVFLALWIFWLGITAGPSALPMAVTLLVLCWATDLLDGPLARRDREDRPGQTEYTQHQETTPSHCSLTNTDKTIPTQKTRLTRGSARTAPPG